MICANTTVHPALWELQGSVFALAIIFWIWKMNISTEGPVRKSLVFCPIASVYLRTRPALPLFEAPSISAQVGNGQDLSVFTPRSERALPKRLTFSNQF